jgi:aminopeptidase YwaD
MKSSHFVKKLILVLVIIFFSSEAIFCWSEEVNLLSQEIIHAIINEVSGEIALQNETMLAPFERIRKTDEFIGQFWESSYIMQKAKEYGLEDVQLHVFPTEEPLWQAKSGELWLVEPEKKKLADIDEIAATLAIYSETTDIKAELEYLERASRPSDYEGKDVSRKIILTADDIEDAQRIGVKEKGSLGIVSYASYTPKQYIDTVGWQWGLLDKDDEMEGNAFFGFSISRRIGEELKSLLLDGQRVVIQAKIEAKFHPGREEVVSAIIPGQEHKEEEFVLVAHLFEGISKQGANDNNSGCACILEVGRCITQLIKEGKIDPPNRTIRFLWVPEYSGTIKYLENNPEIAKKMICGINMDMVGCNLYQNNSPFHIYRTPSSLPSYINYVAETMLDYAVSTNRVTLDGRSYDTIVAPSGSRQNFMAWMDEFDSDSDNDIFNIRQVHVPMVFFCNWTDDFYHSSEDIPKNSDATQLKRAGFLGVAIALAVTNAEETDVLKITADSAARIRSQLALSERKAFSILSQSTKDETAQAYKKMVNLIEQNYRVGLEGLTSCKLLTGDKKILNFIDSLKRKLRSERDQSLEDFNQYYHLLCGIREQEPICLEWTETELRLAKVVPAVKTKMIWPPLQELEEELEIFETRNAAYEAFNYIDGKRTVLDIVRALDAEFVDLGGISPKAVEEYLTALEKDGLIKMKNITL